MVDTLTQGPPRPQLLPILTAPPPQNVRPFPRSKIPLLHPPLVSTKRAPIIIIPSHLNQPLRLRIVVQHRKRTHRPDAHAFIPARMSGHADRAQDVVSGRRFEPEGGGCFEAVDEEGGAAGAGGVREEVEHLQAAGVGEVGRVGVGGQGEGGVGRVFGGEVGGEIPEAA